MELHPQLLQDCKRIGRLPQCEVLLHRNAIIPWLILVPETPLGDLLELPESQRTEVMREAALAGDVLRRQFQLSKINFAAIGNVVPQLHLHVVGRRLGDQCWPRPVWGNLTEQRDYAEDAVREIRLAVQTQAAAAGLTFFPVSRTDSDNPC